MNRRNISMMTLVVLMVGCRSDDDELAPPPTPPNTSFLVTESPKSDTLKRNETKYYSASSDIGSQYVVSITSLTNGLMTLLISRDKYFTSFTSGSVNSTSPMELRLEANDSILYVQANADSLVDSLVTYTILINHAPTLSNPIAEGSTGSPKSVILGAPAEGQVATRSTSYYLTTGLTPGVVYSISITGLTGDADVHLFADETFSLELDHTLRKMPDVSAYPEEYRLTTSASLYFSVSCGEVNHDGAAYTILVR